MDVLRGKGIARTRRPVGARGLRKSWFLLSVTPRPGRLTGLEGLSLLLGLQWPRVPLPYRAQLSEVSPGGAHSRRARLIVFGPLCSRAQDTGSDAQLRAPRMFNVVALLLQQHILGLQQD